MSVIFGLTVKADGSAPAKINKSFGESLGGWDDIQKSVAHKYLRRIPKKNGKGYWYIYAETFKKPLAALKTFFGLQPKSINDTYEKNDIKKDYGADKKTFAAHLLEYLSNKLKWDAFFQNKENREDNKAPRKSPPAGTGGKKTPGKTGGSVDKKGDQGDNKIVLNRSLMRKIWGLYNKTEEENGTNNAGIGSGELSDGSSATRPGGSENDSDQYVPSAEAGDNGGESVQLPVSTGGRPPRNVRITKKQTINIREACLALLNSKTDDQMTEEDKALLRQYEGAGGLGEGNASVHGTLYEYYTPRTVTKKVWEIVDKYLPGKKNVLEPSAGIGRFAEDRPDDTFILNEYDKTSARIAGILHPEKNVKTGAFQEMFKPGKAYTGEKYDVVIGNPPYGTYEGLWKGRGEGKKHKRYEEYFIDRGLDTLREGGIMAFVVPSTFLRSDNSPIKEMLAAKGKLLEAWRLPNGTFNTTGVGTDIVIIRKEKGDPAAFSNNAFFVEHPDMVMGTEVVRTGRFGKEENYINPTDGESFDEAVERIRADKMEAVPIGVKTTAEEAAEKVKVKVADKPNAVNDNERRELIAELEARLETLRPDLEAAKEARRKGIKGSMAEVVIKEAMNIQAEIDKLKKEPKGRSRSEAMMGNQNAAGPHEVDSLAEFNKKYNKNTPEEEFHIWKATRWDGSINRYDIGNTKYLDESPNIIRAVDGEQYHIVNFASGNIYQKLNELEKGKESLTEAEYKRQKAILEAAKPTPKTVFDFQVSPLTDFAIKYVLEEDLNDKQDSLIEGFKDWVWQELGQDSVPPSITKQDVIDYVSRKQVRADGQNDDKAAAAAERDNTIKVRRDTAENLFNQYIREQLSTQEQERMADMWNRQFNAVVDPDHTRIPAFVDGISKTFKGKPLRVSEIQLKGVATLVNRGDGILAYDVGVGKTLTGILATVSQIQTGRAKRPLVCVPKGVYQNWLSEIRQLFPNVKVNELGNFRNLDQFKNENGGLDIEEGTLSVCTYEALEMVSFKQSTIDVELMGDMMDSQYYHDENASERERAKQMERIQTTLGRSTKSGDKQTDWEDTGFDHITIDELHNMKNVFTSAKAKDKGNANEFSKITGGTQSTIALKAFAITQMIQRRNNGRNVFGLTATPFTNSPIEIYNVLSLVAREKLKEAGIYNLHEFMAQFAALKSELAVDPQGDVEEKTVMKEFKNLAALQKLINTYIDKVDGEEAGVIRPRDFTHFEDCTMNMTAAQKSIADQIIHYMTSASSEDDPGATLKGINALRNLVLSPMLVDGMVLGKKDNPKAPRIKITPDVGDFVTSSPKMTFVCDSAATLYKKNPDQGQVIYLPRGVKHYGEVKAYLAKRGIPEDAVAFMSPQHLPSGKVKNADGTYSDRGDLERERIMADFNDPNGKIKVIVGSETILEGINLNGNSSTLYDCMLGWNPTEFIQLKGRIHRQGNKQGHVHIVIPLMNDSIDSFMYQKHDEKAKRISAIFSYKGDTLNVEEINPEEVKFGLIKDPKKRADMQIKQEVEVIKNQVLLAQVTCDKIVDNASRHRELQEEITTSQKQVEAVKKAAKKIGDMTDAELIKQFGNKYDDDDESIDHSFDEFDGVKGSSWVEGKTPKEFRANYDRQSKHAVQQLQKYISSAKSKSGTVENTLKRYNVDPFDEKSAESVAAKFGKEAVKLKEKIEHIEDKQDEYVERARVQIAAEAKPGKTVSEAVQLTTSKIMSNLRPMSEVEGEILKEREAKNGAETKKSIIFVIDSIIPVNNRKGA